MKYPPHTLSIDYDVQLRQAYMTAHDYLLHALTDIEELTGIELRRNPEKLIALQPLICAYMNTAASDYLAGNILRASENIAAALPEAEENV